MNQKSFILSEWYDWYITRLRVTWSYQKRLSPYYAQKKEASSAEASFVATIFDGKIQVGGLADRLRGILSTYYICKKTGRPFKLHFVSPFNLELFLVPNQYDWRCKEHELCFDKHFTSVLPLFTTRDGLYQSKKQEQWLYNHISRTDRQCHVYTNALFSYEYDYKQLFFELFKPSDALQQTLDHYRDILGASYISISCRFLDLLDDFNETQAINASLTDVEKRALIERVLYEIDKLHLQYPNRTILCNSDSITFLNEAAKMDYTYVVPGEITHLEGMVKRDDYQLYEKTFVDFFLIAKASHIYLLKTGLMYDSGFPYAASKLYGKPFDKIVF